MFLSSRLVSHSNPDSNHLFSHQHGHAQDSPDHKQKRQQEIVEIRGGKLAANLLDFKFGAWSVEGLSDSKVVELIVAM